jgi:hypothetical protein
VSLGGLSGGDDHPGADSAVLDHDASTDAKAPPADGTSPQDVALATDGESSADTGDDTRPEDSGKKKGDAGCVPLVFDGGSALSCAGSDASTCSPQNLGNYKPVWVPPRAPLSACTSSQISTYVTDCIADEDAGACSSFEGDTTNFDCMLSPLSSSETEYGPLLNAGGAIELNLGGCVALKDPCQTPCAVALEAELQCLEATCGVVCPLTDMAAETAYDDCLDKAATCSCLPETKVADDCQTELVGTPAAVCFPVMDFVMGAETLGMIFCGGGT